jgi:DHA1 family bicyclomycin/chloramphenicol resistance-like MFS transporter
VRVLATAGAALLLCALSGAGGFAGVLAPIFFAVGSIGLIAPNASAVAMEPFGANAGGAASLLGSAQAVGGVVASAAVGSIDARGALPMAIVVFACAGLSFASYALLVKRERIAT